MDASTTNHFPIRVEPRYRLILRLFGVTPANSYVDLGERLEARFGWSHVSTPVSNCKSWSIEGPWFAITALGVRMSLRHRDLTFGGSTEAAFGSTFANASGIGGSGSRPST